MPHESPRSTGHDITAPQLSELVSYLEQIAPPAFAESWDHVGLLAAPDMESPVRKVVIALDLTPEVYRRCRERKTDLLICYHPPLFTPVQTLVPRDQSPPALAMRLFRLGTAIYSPHTALDVAEGGTNDALAAALNIRVQRSMLPGRRADSQYKLITFVPAESVEKLATAVFAAGAGHIGKNSRYTCCSFRTPGHGTFRGDETTHPAVGEKGRLEVVPEIRWETIVDQDVLGPCIAALKAAHPYEEPAFDIIPLANPSDTPGMGRIGMLPAAMRLDDLARHAKKHLQIEHVQVGGSSSRPLRTCAIVAGSAGKLALDAHRKSPFDVLITGELKHHDLLAHRAAGIHVLLLGHGESEAPVSPALAASLQQRCPRLRISVVKPEPMAKSI
jgi:dinuclear metal center YbgI/SA1388 family protein